MKASPILYYEYTEWYFILCHCIDGKPSFILHTLEKFRINVLYVLFYELLKPECLALGIRVEDSPELASYIDITRDIIVPIAC